MDETPERESHPGAKAPSFVAAADGEDGPESGAGSRRAPAPERAPRKRARLLALVGLALAAAAALVVAVLASAHDDLEVPAPSASIPDPAPTTSESPTPDPPGRCPPSMVLVSGGSFEMGDDAGPPEARPAHRVRVSTFCLERTEVTVGAYRECVAAGACPQAGTRADWSSLTEAERPFWSSACNAALPDRDAHPMNCIDWDEAQAYCRFTRARLPTEAEWEYAARGSDGRPFPWGDSPPNGALLNACGPECSAWAATHGRQWERMYDTSDGYALTAPVGSFPAGASPFGVLDMAGNVWEWTASPYSNDYGSAPNDAMRVPRGGGWGGFIDGAASLRSTRRGRFYRTTRGPVIGVRCARDAAP